MRNAISILLLLIGSAVYAQEPIDTLSMQLDPLDSNQVHRMGFTLSGGMHQLLIQPKSGQTAFSEWDMPAQGFYKAGLVYSARLSKSTRLLTGLSVCNVSYTMHFKEDTITRNDTNAYSTLEIPFDYQFTIYKGLQASVGLVYQIDITKNLMRERRVIELTRSNLSARAAIGYRFVMGPKFIQTDLYVQHGVTSILTNSENRYSKALQSIYPLQIGLRFILY